MTIIPGNYYNIYIGLSTEVKPTVNVPNASICYEMDTKKSYMFDAINSQWREQ